MTVQIKFGTDGWRGIIARDYTFDNVARVSQAVADYVLASGGQGKGIAIGYDTRFLSQEFAREAASVLAGNGVKVYFSQEIVPTPVLSHGVVHLKAFGGVVITASHNPSSYNGFKYKGEFGGSGSPDQIQSIEEKLKEVVKVRRISFDEGVKNGIILLSDLKTPYLERIKKLVEIESLRKGAISIVSDPMFGAGRGYLMELLAGGNATVKEIHGEINPGFGGLHPEPIMPYLKSLSEAVSREKAQVGLATDGDGDRIGVVGSHGEYLNSHQVFALIFQHLVEVKGWTGAVVKTFALSELVDKMAADYGIKLYKTPIGFKYVCELMQKEDILMGGEESGGIGIKNHIPERDGILMALLLLEIMAVRKKPLEAVYADLEKKYGSYRYDRVDLHISEEQKNRVLQRFSGRPLKEIGPFGVREIDSMDGYKFYFEKGGWLLVRPSGTEPLLRVYCEGSTQGEVKEILSKSIEMIKAL